MRKVFCIFAHAIFNESLQAGCLHLSADARGGLCHACCNSFVPCVYLLSGCTHYVARPLHSRKRKRCSSHDHTVCIFDPKRSKLRCETRYYENLRDSAFSALCSDCRQGHTPCLERCGRRLNSIDDPLCCMCLKDTPDPAARAATLLPTRSDVPWNSCSTPNCPYLVEGHDKCALCATSCFPCSTLGCKRRSLPNSEGKCSECLGLHLQTRRVSRASSQNNVPCAFARVGCTRTASSFKSSSRPLCTECYRNGFPCRFASAGCVQTLSLHSAATSDTCLHCLKRGPPCTGLDGTGCKNLEGLESRRVPRRRLPSNGDCCLLCRPAYCSVWSCKRRIHSLFWSQKRCCFHGKLSRAQVNSDPSHAPDSATVPRKAPSASDGPPAMELHTVVPLSCCILGCTEVARPSSFVKPRDKCLVSLTKGCSFVLCQQLLFLNPLPLQHAFGSRSNAALLSIDVLPNHYQEASCRSVCSFLFAMVADFWFAALQRYFMISV